MRNLRVAAALIAVLVLFGAAGPIEAAAPSVGDPAPDFSLPYATSDTIIAQGEPLSAAVRKGPVILAFYPADWSAGCTREVCSMRAAFAELALVNATVWGISGDSVHSHRAWAKHHGLPFRLLSDIKHDVARQYDSFNADSGFTRRTVFVIGEDMRVLYADTDYSVKDTADFEALKAALARVSG